MWERERKQLNQAMILCIVLPETGQVGITRGRMHDHSTMMLNVILRAAPLCSNSFYNHLR